MRLAYFYSRYPVLSQTFCDTEMIALERMGFSFSCKIGFDCAAQADTGVNA